MNLREKILSRQFGAAVFMSVVSTALLFYWVFFKCIGETYDFESAIKAFESWGELNLWNFSIFIAGDTGKKVITMLQTKKGQTTT